MHGEGDALMKVLSFRRLLESLLAESVPLGGILTAQESWEVLGEVLIFLRNILEHPHYSRRRPNADLSIKTEYSSKAKNSGMVISRKIPVDQQPI
jgi:hypothetical protein